MTGKGLLGIFVGLLCLAGVARAEMDPPDVLIDKTVKEVLAIIKQDKDIQTGNQRKVLELVDAKVLPHFNFERMTKLAVGKNWRSANPEQRKELVAEFRNLLVRTYTRAFTEYRDQVVEIRPLRMAPDATEATVRTLIKKAGGSIPVDYEMEKTAAGWKAFDVSIEGASMVTSYRGTFNSEIQEKGIDGLIRTLADKNTSAAGSQAHKPETK